MKPVKSSAHSKTGAKPGMISCSQYDYIEIVCLYHYPIAIQLKSGEYIQGVAMDTQRNEAREECIKIDVQGSEECVVLDQIKRLEVRVENPHFQVMSFE